MDNAVKTQFVRRCRGGPITDNHTSRRRAFRQRLLFWGCFSGNGGPGPFVHVNSTMKTANYIDTLKHHLLPYRQTHFRGNSSTFQHDNAPCHASRPTLDFLQVNRVRTLQWPPYSPDLNPIENLWSIIKQRIHRKPVPTKEAVIAAAHKEWNDPSVKELCTTLANSMVERVSSCIASKGGFTKY